MNIGEYRILKVDNVFRGKNWGIKGEKVKIISISGTAVVYENRKGNRFPCNINDLE
ncbi:hypothetical protein [Elizabethkingia meningoseptica]|uniref:hypothetical protein n=1 Tax=Elizabethkingia meningoseptica TaxID=238 RepID=UPI0013653DC0|nr:hypothetical protein [Elizabethkingia meningoseptica]